MTTQYILHSNFLGDFFRAFNMKFVTFKWSCRRSQRKHVETRRSFIPAATSWPFWLMWNLGLKNRVKKKHWTSTKSARAAAFNLDKEKARHKCIRYMGLSKMCIYNYIFILHQIYYTPPPKTTSFPPKRNWSLMAWLRWIHFPLQKTNRVPKLLQTAHGSGRMSGWMVMVRFAVKFAGGSSCKLSGSFNPMRMKKRLKIIRKTC